MCTARASRHFGGCTVTDLERLKSEYVAARKTYLTAEQQYHDALCAEYPFQPGDVIKAANGAIARVE